MNALTHTRVLQTMQSWNFEISLISVLTAYAVCSLLSVLAGCAV
jgi:hypothetical protein